MSARTGTVQLMKLWDRTTAQTISAGTDTCCGPWVEAAVVCLLSRMYLTVQLLILKWWIAELAYKISSHSSITSQRLFASHAGVSLLLSVFEMSKKCWDQWRGQTDWGLTASHMVHMSVLMVGGWTELWVQRSASNLDNYSNVET